MADYSTLQMAIDSGITNMTVIRNNSGNDDRTDTIPTGITWFNFNSVQVTNLYVSGNSWIGFGASSEQLKVNRRDCKVYYEYTETGTIGKYNFLKFRWVGYSAYSATSDDALCQYDIFLIDNGQIYLNWFDVPTSNFNGTNALICGSETVSYTATAGVACEMTFTPSDATAGTGWSVVPERPNLITNYKTPGTLIYSTDVTKSVTKYNTSTIGWVENVSDGTTLTVKTAMSDSTPDDLNYQKCTNGGEIPGIVSGDDLSAKTLYLKIEMSTTDITLTPSLSNLTIVVRDKKDPYFMVIKLNDFKRFLNVEGNLTVAYDSAKGNLSGLGGPVGSFSKEFTPSGLIQKPNPHDMEHINIASISAASNLMRIYYTNAYGNEHVNIASITAVGTLTNIDDL